ncbi:TPA: hypothetical protein L9R01_003873 [Klebsiella pneumoniae]|nr:hypothetical protein [Klebsiella pneumoniae]HBT2409883.1 hypothetical protein [Klebsiella pneumoniae subsp. pneumoniae]HDS7983444.1 hypothetical protein [Klebsiella pneumoniae]HDT1784558.1 hypothetical protein [Klebsiella pneumoniae]HDU3590855.1 hypothetical protein [Klebsiella pneumoniae subsp. pneumoniae]
MNADTEELNFIHGHLESCGYQLSPHGAAVALMLMESDYSKEESLSYLGLIALAQDMISSGKGINDILNVSKRGKCLIEIIGNLHKNGLIRYELYLNDISAIKSITFIEENYGDIIKLVINSDPHANADRVADPI